MSEHILVVDDSRTIRNFISFVLKKGGYRVSCAEDGLDGLETLYSAEQVDLIISDINMPRMDGFTFIRTVREQEVYATVPIIVLSTESKEEDIAQGMEAGADAYLVKPTQPEKLIETIQELLA